MTPLRSIRSLGCNWMSFVAGALDSYDKVQCIASPGECSIAFDEVQVDPFTAESGLLKLLDHFFLAFLDRKIKRFGNRAGALERTKCFQVELTFVRLEHDPLFTNPQNFSRHQS